MTMKLSAFGQEVRRLRLELEERLLDMAAKLGKTPAFLSAVETGRRPPPPALVDDLIRLYVLDEQRSRRLRQAAAQSRETFTLRTESAEDKELVAAFARRFPTLDDADREKLLQILNGGGKR